MFYGFTESESFYDPTVLNNYPHHKIVIEKRSDGKGYWHIFILAIQKDRIEQTVKDISASLKPDWNAVFYDEHSVYCVFKDRYFILKRQKNWKISDYQEVKQFAKQSDVGDLDMNEVFKHYNTLLSLK